MIEFHKSNRSGDNGEFVVVSDEADPDMFIRNFSSALSDAIQYTEEVRDDLEHALSYIIPYGIEIYLKLKGYKTNNSIIREKRLIICGHTDPYNKVFPLSADKLAAIQHEEEYSFINDNSDQSVLCAAILIQMPYLINEIEDKFINIIPYSNACAFLLLLIQTIRHDLGSENYNTGDILEFFRGDCAEDAVVKLAVKPIPMTSEKAKEYFINFIDHIISEHGIAENAENINHVV